MPSWCCSLNFIVNTTTPKTALQQCWVIRQNMIAKQKQNWVENNQFFRNLYYTKKHIKGGWVGKGKPSRWQQMNWILTGHSTRISHTAPPPKTPALTPIHQPTFKNFFLFCRHSLLQKPTPGLRKVCQDLNVLFYNIFLNFMLPAKGKCRDEYAFCLKSLPFVWILLIFCKS